MKGKLILENGAVFEGKAFGYTEKVETVGEVVFNTGMTGYQEIMTDPSYTGQIVTMTYPLIGNYGINLEDIESDGPKVKGFIVREWAASPSHWRCEMDLEGYLRQNKILGLCDIDTRALTKLLRNHGTMRGLITVENPHPKTVLNRLNTYSNVDAIHQVTTPQPYELPGTGKRVAVLDFGIKENILRSLTQRDCHLTVYPATTGAAEILAGNPDGIVLSNGPGDPKDISEALETIRTLVAAKPLFGICMGNQLLTLSQGGDTEKLKFGHRGCNHPVKDLINGKVYITSQNHGYVVSPDKLPPTLEVTHVSLNDGSIEGVRHKTRPAFGVQYHPEASPGPRENDYLFERFMKLMEENAHA